MSAWESSCATHLLLSTSTRRCADYYLTDGFADMATSHDPTPFLLTLKANADLGFGISMANLPT